MEPVRVTQDDLARDPSAILETVRREGSALVERQGEPQAAIIDVIDYRLLRAAAHAQVEPPGQAANEHTLVQELSDKELAKASDTQARYNLVVKWHLAGLISTGRMAELLGLPFIDLSTRFHRLGIPLRVGPPTVEEIRRDTDVAGRFVTR
jgi:hypothetical protein